MTKEQKAVKIFAIVLAFFICASIFSAIVGSLGFVFSWFDDSYRGGYVTSEEIPLADIDIEKIEKLAVDLGAVNLDIRSGSSFKIEKANTRSNIAVKMSGSTLKVEERSHNFWNIKHDGTVIITVPTDANLGKLDIDQGAGTVTIRDVYAKDFDFDQGAGTLSIDNCRFDRTDLNGGVGKMTVRSSVFRDLDLDGGVGAIDIEAKLIGKTDIDGGVGSLRLRIDGEKEDYTFNIEKGLGSITVDGSSQSGSFGNGSNRIEIDGGVGSISVAFN